MRYKGIVFDLDGTLIDSAPVVQSILNVMRRDRGLSPLSIESYRSWSSEGGTVLVSNALELLVDQADPFVRDFRARYHAYSTPMESLYPGVLDFLLALQQRNISMGICSNKPESLCKKVLSETSLLSFFSTIVGGDTFKTKKPNSEPLLAAIGSLGLLPQDVLFIGDSLIDKNTAWNAAVDFAYFPSGYDALCDIDPGQIRVKSYKELINEIDWVGG